MMSGFMMHAVWRDRRVLVASAVFVVSAVVFGWAAREALTITPGSAQVAAAVLPALQARIPIDDSEASLIDDAIDLDPFRPERAPSDARYGDAPIPVTAAAPSPAAPVLRLVGTVIDRAGGGFAMCQLGLDAPRVVRLGEQLGGYRLQSLAPERAVFVNDRGERLALRVPTTGSQPDVR